MCVGVLSVGLGPGLDSMSPARSRRSASHAAGTHGRLPQKTGRPGLRRGGVGGYNLHSVPPTVALWHTNHEQAVSVWCSSSVYSPFSDRVGLPPHNTPFPGVLLKSTPHYHIPLSCGHHQILTPGGSQTEPSQAKQRTAY